MPSSPCCARAAADPTGDNLDQLADLFDRCGSVAFARDFARGVSEAAADAFPEAFARTSRPDAAEIVGQLVDYVVERTR